MIHFTKLDGQFKPYYKSDLTTWEKLREGIIYTMRYKQDRNARHHRKLFAIAQLIIDNVPEGNPWEDKTPYQLIKATEIPLGYVDETITLSGEIIMMPQSISFEEWPQEIFEEFYNKAVNYWAGHFNYTIEDLENNFDY